MWRPNRYRTRDEISSIRTQRDPVEYVRKLLLDHELVDSAELKKIEKVLQHPEYRAVLHLSQGCCGWSGEESKHSMLMRRSASFHRPGVDVMKRGHGLRLV